MSGLFFWGGLFFALMAGYGVRSENYELTVYCLAMIFVAGIDSIIDAIRKKNAN